MRTIHMIAAIDPAMYFYHLSSSSLNYLKAGELV